MPSAANRHRLDTENIGHGEAARRWQAAGRSSGLCFAPRFLRTRSAGSPRAYRRAGTDRGDRPSLSRVGTARRGVATFSPAALPPVSCSARACRPCILAARYCRGAAQNRGPAARRRVATAVAISSGCGVAAHRCGRFRQCHGARYRGLTRCRGGIERPYSFAAEAALFNADRHRQETGFSGRRPPRRAPGLPGDVQPGWPLCGGCVRRRRAQYRRRNGTTAAALSSHSQWVGNASFVRTDNASWRTPATGPCTSGRFRRAKRQMVFNSDNDSSTKGARSSARTEQKIGR